MNNQPAPDEHTACIDERLRDAWLVIFMAVAASSLRIAIWAANAITLWHLYGWPTVARDHLRVVKVKPQLVVSNGDILRGVGPYHYLIGVAVWLPLTIGLMSVIYYALLPKRHREALQSKKQSQGGSVAAALWALALPILVTAVLPMWAALSVAAGSVAVALMWTRKI